MSNVRYDPTKCYYKSTVGAVAENEFFDIRIQLNYCVRPSAVTLVIYNDNDGKNVYYTMSKEDSCNGWDSYTVNLSLKKGLYFYYFLLDGVTYERFIGKSANNKASMFYDKVQPWQLSVYCKKYDTPTWLNNGVMYQIMVDRFCQSGTTVVTEDKIMRKWGEQPYFCESDGTVRNRDFFGGNLNGITEKLPYLSKLNVKTIYLNPIFKAYSNHKYDTEDYELIDSMFGTLDDFTNLCKKADELGIKIVLDGVFNHVGSSSKYFNRDGKYGKGGAYNDVNSPYRKWFSFNEDNSYECWWNFSTLPRINAESKDAQNYFCGKNGIVSRWLTNGACGWRLDVVDEIADCMLDKIVSLAKCVKRDSAIIGEVWEDASNKIDYGVRRHYLDGSQLDSVMNYPLCNAIIDFVRDGNEKSLSCAVFNIVNNYPLHVRNNLMNILGTHDTARILTRLAGDRLNNAPKNVMAVTKLSESQYKQGVELLKTAVLLQYTFFGFPCVYYGDEVGMEGYGDPFCRGCYPWNNQNKLLLDFYTRMGEIRQLQVFRDGDFDEIIAENSVYAFARKNDQEEVFVAVNRSKYDYNCTLNGNYVDLLTGRQYNNYCNLQPNGYVLLKRING